MTRWIVALGAWLAFAAGASAQVVASFTTDMNLGAGYLETTFTDTSTTGGPAISAWSWDFGDGGSSTEQHPVHAFASGGIYDVTLTVTVEGTDHSVTRERLVVVADLNRPAEEATDLSGAVILVNDGTRPKAEAKVPVVLAEEIQKRTGLSLATTTTLSTTGNVIAVAAYTSNKAISPEGYTLFTEAAEGRTIVWIIGNGPRGALYGAGALLRRLD